jgi:hypothetical protein
MGDNQDTGLERVIKTAVKNVSDYRKGVHKRMPSIEEVKFYVISKSPSTEGISQEDIDKERRAIEHERNQSITSSMMKMEWEAHKGNVNFNRKQMTHSN